MTDKISQLMLTYTGMVSTIRSSKRHYRDLVSIPGISDADKLKRLESLCSSMFEDLTVIVNSWTGGMDEEKKEEKYFNIVNPATGVDNVSDKIVNYTLGMPNLTYNTGSTLGVDDPSILAGRNPVEKNTVFGMFPNPKLEEKKAP